MRYEAAKVPTDDAVPGRALTFIELSDRISIRRVGCWRFKRRGGSYSSLDVLCDILNGGEHVIIQAFEVEREWVNNRPSQP